MEDYFSIQVTLLGANLGLLEDKVEGELETLAKEGKDQFSQWFREGRPWKPSNVYVESVTWLRFYGIPVEDWNHEFFLSLIGGIGAYLCAYDNTRACTKMHVARLLLRTKHSKDLTEDIEAILNGYSFNIKIVENSQGPLRIQT